MRKEKKNFFMMYEYFLIVIILGFVLAISSLLKILGVINISSDWFWFLAGLGLIVEAVISLNKQIRFDKKYKILEKK
ncbi:hypothetical protein CL618_00495 [archaeon]|nr:hypothetical protein [archaeon]|tara:strand:+ start:1318 stop:1548 length:231 start_codon:yes stop_codon:yes gene_type:complete